ncbi:site-specific integrase [Streptomyces sp. NPDC005409]|uniref:site-specific integrase n=1 Tax=Streptomyces sp. NPDC005409 TaxID=3155342 RepID=UPI0034530E08
MVDSGLLDFVRSKEFRNLERESKRNYATDIRILLEFLSSRGVAWQQATEQDLVDFRDWRCRAVENPQRVGGTKWNREAAAFTKLFKWGKVYPLPVDISRREDRAADSVSARVSWLTPRTWGLGRTSGCAATPGPGWRRPGGSRGRRSATPASCSFC